MVEKCSTEREALSRELCNECIFKRQCKDGKIGRCPCRDCLIKMVCITVCKEASLFFSKVSRMIDEQR